MTTAATTRDAIARAERDADQRVAVPQIILSTDQILDGHWMAGTPCRDSDPEIFHGPGAMEIAAAQDVCAECSFNQACRAFRYAAGASGTWGGVYYPDSGARAGDNRKKCALQRCTNGVRTNNSYCSFACEHKSKAGTRAGYDLHQKVLQAARAANTQVTDDARVCGPCRDAKAADRGQRPSASGSAQNRRPVPIA